MGGEPAVAPGFGGPAGWVTRRRPAKVGGRTAWCRNVHRVASRAVIEAWAADIAAAGGRPHDECRDTFARMADEYASPVRRYHTLEHVTEVLDWVDRLGPEWRAPVRLAGWLHDVIYDPTRNGNERASAEWARRELPALGVGSAVVDETARLIEMTETHEVDPGDANAAVLADADLAILGASAERYERYARDVRSEYSFVPDPAFRAARRAILEAFLDRDHIYRVERARRELEAPARRNLAWEVGELAG